MEWKISTELVEYEDALQFMDERVAQIHEGGADECVWLLEHPALYTAGTSAKDADLIDATALPVFKTGRGGEYTYHGPGQRVGYLNLNLKKRQQAPDIKHYVWQLEEWIIRTLAAFDIQGERRCGRIGIWVVMPDGPEKGCEKKIAAIGVRVRRWITMHGIAINVGPDLSHFSGIVPCGIAEHGVTSMADLGVKASMGEVDKVLQDCFDEVFSLPRAA
ncbi:MAG: lipoyl(octanoyl) transferase LipB [Pseudomonadota bacterium]